jgi:hypothetical protein
LFAEIEAEIRADGMTIVEGRNPNDDDLTDELLASNDAFRALVAKSAASPRKPFSPETDTQPG